MANYSVFFSILDHSAMASGDVRGETSSSGESDPGADDEGDIVLHVLAVTDAAQLAVKLTKEKWRRRLNDANHDAKTPLHLAVMATMVPAVTALVEGESRAVWRLVGRGVSFGFHGRYGACGRCASSLLSAFFPHVYG